jgi:hypothetical protein
VRLQDARGWKKKQPHSRQVRDAHSPNLERNAFTVQLRGASSYPDYGGRGIKVCQRWDSFEAFLEDMGECPNDNHSIERKDVDGNYDPENCVWLPLPLQARNKRNNRRITIGDDTRTLAEWCELYAVRRELVKDRLKLGWDPFDALTLSPGSRRPRSESIL